MIRVKVPVNIIRVKIFSWDRIGYRAIGAGS